MKNNLINFIFTINKRNKTIKDIAIIFTMPWLLFIFTLVTNYIASFLKKSGINTMYIVPRVVFIGCLGFSIAGVVLYFYSWRKIYKSYIKNSKYPPNENTVLKDSKFT